MVICMTIGADSSTDPVEPPPAAPRGDTTALLALLGLVLAAAPKVLEVLRRPRR